MRLIMTEIFLLVSYVSSLREGNTYTKFACITHNNRIARSYYLYLRINFTRYSFITRRAPVHRARFINAKAIAATDLDWNFPWKSLNEGRTEKKRQRERGWEERGKRNLQSLPHVASRITIMEITNASPSVSHSGSDVCLRNMIKRSRLSSTRGLGLTAAATDEGRRGSSSHRAEYRHENDHLSGFINFLDGAYYVWRIVCRWNKAE